MTSASVQPFRPPTPPGPHPNSPAEGWYQWATGQWTYAHPDVVCNLRESHGAATIHQPPFRGAGWTGSWGPFDGRVYLNTDPEGAGYGWKDPHRLAEALEERMREAGLQLDPRCTVSGIREGRADACS